LKILVPLPVTVSCNSESGHHYFRGPEQKCSGLFNFCGMKN
jgi:hypothetical protein